jgi:hypothetical protein
MSDQVGASPASSCYGRRVVEQARRLGISPATIVRHIRRGKRLSDGRVVRIAATVTPGGYRVRDEDVDRFYEAITSDRLGTAASQEPRLARRPPRRAGDDVDDELARQGW